MTQPKIWIVGTQRDVPEWVLTGLADTHIAEDGTLTIDGPEGPEQVPPRQPVFEFGGYLHTCTSPSLVRSELARLQQLWPKGVIKTNGHSRPSPARARPPVSIIGPAKMPKAMKGTPPTPQQCIIGELLIDDTYQRTVESSASKALIRKIATNWDWRLYVPLMVSKRDDGLYVIDGQHRLHAALARGDIAYMPCCVQTYDDVAEEARLFAEANKARKAPGHLDIFRALVASEDEGAIEIRSMIERVGLSVARVQSKASIKPGDVTFITTIRKGIAKRGAEDAEHALRLMAQGFPDQVLTIGASMFQALLHLVVTMPTSKLDDETVALVLREKPMTEWGECLKDAACGEERGRIMRDTVNDAYRAAIGEGVE